ncbi:MAG: hydrogenase maturation nickel metallochaperone HypA [Deltaproteobacteria bacterium]|nr:hydrogenase maturation nickel metallochaperone HypA [Deltaproteobacteria bacterium]
MHEMSLAAALIEDIVRIAQEHQAIRVEAVELHVGALKQVVPEILAEAFKAVAIGTPAEGAVLTQIEIPPRSLCQGCGQEFVPSPSDFLCPYCGALSMITLQGDELILSSLTCATP